MKKCPHPFYGLVLAFVFILTSCSVPRKIFPQKDIRSFEINQSSLEKRILLAASSSEFKDAIVDRIRNAFKNDSVYIKCIGLSTLDKEDGKRYSAIILMNTCIAWRMDPKIERFLKQHPADQERILVLSTSGDGNWKPCFQGQKFDAVSSASKKEQLDEISDRIINQTRLLLQAKNNDKINPFNL